MMRIDLRVEVGSVKVKRRMGRDRRFRTRRGQRCFSRKGQGRGGMKFGIQDNAKKRRTGKGVREKGFSPFRATRPRRQAGRE